MFLFKRQKSSVVFGIALSSYLLVHLAHAESGAEMQSPLTGSARIHNLAVPLANPPIVLKHSLSIRIAYDSDFQGNGCTNKNLDNAPPLATVTLIDDNAVEQKIGEVRARDLWPGGGCDGHFETSKNFPIALPANGHYLLVLTLFSALDRWKAGTLTITPRIQLSADEVVVVDQSVPSNNGEQIVSKAYSVLYK